MCKCVRSLCVSRGGSCVYRVGYLVCFLVKDILSLKINMVFFLFFQLNPINRRLSSGFPILSMLSKL